MIASTMLYLMAVSVVASAAALAASDGLRRLELPTRFVWLTALLLGPLFVLGRWLLRLLPTAPRVPTGLLEIPISLPEFLVGGGGSAWRIWLENGLAFAWIGGFALLVLVLLRGQAVLILEKRAALSVVVHEETVFVTTRRGPGVAGLIRPWIIVPEWALTLPEDQLRMVIVHESEHVRAGDSRLIAAALGLTVLAWWNPVAWWQLGRLRTAMELDCDRRVLAREQDARVYGTALLAVAAGVAPDRTLGLAAFSENAHSLRTRILAMTSKRARWAGPVGAASLVVAVGLVVQACGIESPVAPVGANRNRNPVPVQIDGRPPTSSTNGPYFTPFSAAPILINRADVVKALETNYPTLLREAGIEGRADIWLQITSVGDVVDVRINRSTGHEALDIAAIKVGEAMRFEPAELDGKPVMVWVSVPITFKSAPPAPK